ncbi:MAG: hypothetical protein H0X30_09075 [Anaerolineae bacterium]|nr:hypothetical protein [Anaerolineae bacterium]
MTQVDKQQEVADLVLWLCQKGHRLSQAAIISWTAGMSHNSLTSDSDLLLHDSIS